MPYRATGRSWRAPKLPNQSAVLLETMRQQIVDVDPEKVETTWLGLRLNQEHLDELQSRLYGLLEEFKDRGPDPDGEAYSLVAVLHPDLNPGLHGGRSNGCAYADSPGHVPVQRMANVSLQPDPAGPDVDGLVSQVERGLYVVGDRSWSIDMQRKNFQFTGQRFHLIEDGRITGQVRDAAYQATTTDFWGSMEAVGGPQTWELGGAVNCGKAQPGQVAPVSHGCPAALFRDVRILNTNDEAAH